VRGLTTAACLWCVAAIGMAAGGGFYAIALITTIVALVSLIFLKYVERLYSKDTYRVLSVRAPIEVGASHIIEIVKNNKIRIINCDIEKNYQAGTSLTRLSILLTYKDNPDKYAHGMITALEKSALPLQEIKWENM
jgi:putative Mg2+ transporter-C (MgtC) family protein